MGSLLGSVGNTLTGKGSPSASNLGGTSGLLGLGQTALAGGDVNLSNQVSGLAGNLGPYANTMLSGGQQQYQAGLGGQLTPAQQALTDYTTGQNRTAMNQIYSGLGLGGSTMNTQDLNAINEQSLAQQEQIDFANQQMGLQAMGLGGQMTGEQGQLYGEAGNLKGDAGKLLGGQQNNINSILDSLLTSAGNAGGVGGAGGTGSLAALFGAPTSSASGALSAGGLNMTAPGLGDTAFNFLTGGSNLGADAVSAAGSAGAADTLSSFIPDIAAAFA